MQLCYDTLMASIDNISLINIPPACINPAAICYWNIYITANLRSNFATELLLNYYIDNFSYSICPVGAFGPFLLSFSFQLPIFLIGSSTDICD